MQHDPLASLSALLRGDARCLLCSLRAAAAFADGGDRLLMWNHRFARCAGVSEEKLRGRRRTEFFTLECKGTPEDAGSEWLARPVRSVPERVFSATCSPVADGVRLYLLLDITDAFGDVADVLEEARDLRRHVEATLVERPFVPFCTACGKMLHPDGAWRPAALHPDVLSRTQGILHAVCPGCADNGTPRRGRPCPEDET